MGTRTREELSAWIAKRNMPLYISEWSPGDGVTRYRFFFRQPTNYFAGNGMYTALGRKEAWIFMYGYTACHDRCSEEGTP